MIRFLWGDAITKLRELPAEHVHCCVTSPPYWALRDYGTATWEGGDPACVHAVRTSETLEKQVRSSRLQDGKKTVGHQQEGYRQICHRCGARRRDQQLGLEATLDCLGWATGTPCGECYLCHMVQVFSEVKRVLRRDGTLWLNIGSCYIEKQEQGVPWRLALALQADGWWLRQDIVWSKANPLPESVTDRCTKSHEYMFLLTKSAKYFWDQEAVREDAVAGWNGSSFTSTHDIATKPNLGQGERIEPTGRNLRSVWHIPSEPFPGAHFATMPSALVERCLLAGTSAHGVCSACGAPWVRQVERTFVGSYHDHKNDGVQYGLRQNGAGPAKTWIPPKPTGWLPSCACNAPVGRAMCLDPFSGAGTVGLVADRLGRDATLIELNKAYIDMARERITSEAPLLVREAL